MLRVFQFLLALWTTTNVVDVPMTPASCGDLGGHVFVSWSVWRVLIGPSVLRLFVRDSINARLKLHVCQICRTMHMGHYYDQDNSEVWALLRAIMHDASESTTCRIRAYVHTYSGHTQDPNCTHAGYSAHAHDSILRGRADSLGHNRGVCVRKISVEFCFKQRVRNVFDHHTKY